MLFEISTLCATNTQAHVRPSLCQICAVEAINSTCGAEDTYDPYSHVSPVCVSIETGSVAVSQQAAPPTFAVQLERALTILHNKRQTLADKLLTVFVNNHFLSRCYLVNFVSSSPIYLRRKSRHFRRQSRSSSPSWCRTTPLCRKDRLTYVYVITLRPSI